MENKLGVALVKELCPICAKTIDGPIIMNTVLTKSKAAKVEEMNGKVIGFSEDCCKECKENSKVGFPLIIIDEEKSGKTFKEIYRTGQLFFVKKDIPLVTENTQFHLKTKSTSFMFIDKKAALELNLIQNE